MMEMNGTLPLAMVPFERRVCATASISMIVVLTSHGPGVSSGRRSREQNACTRCPDPCSRAAALRTGSRGEYLREVSARLLPIPLQDTLGAVLESGGCGRHGASRMSDPGGSSVGPVGQGFSLSCGASATTTICASAEPSPDRCPSRTPKKSASVATRHSRAVSPPLRRPVSPLQCLLRQILCPLCGFSVHGLSPGLLAVLVRRPLCLFNELPLPTTFCERASAWRISI